jgi:hypothetical protein
MEIFDQNYMYTNGWLIKMIHTISCCRYFPSTAIFSDREKVVLNFVKLGRVSEKLCLSYIIDFLNILKLMTLEHFPSRQPFFRIDYYCLHPKE